MLFGIPVTKANKMERFVGKQSILSLQYGASWKVFQRMCRVMGGMIITEEEARKYVSDYRRIAKPITDYWKSSSRFIEAMANGNMVSHKSIFTSKEKIHLPSGLCLRYPELWYEKVARSEVLDPTKDKQVSGWRYGDGIGLFGAKVMENECQALARIIVTDAGTRVRRQYKISYKLQVHDELVYVVPAEQAKWLRDVVVRELSTPPSWAPDLPLAAEGGIGDNYGEVK
jgi:DNA polymerase